MPTSEHSPPDTIKVRWCQSCGMDDRYRHLRDRHRPSFKYDGPREKGGICHGPVVEVTYRRVR